MKKKGEYIRLPGRGLKRGGSALFIRTHCSLWLGEDHLLSLHSTGYNEEYKRFYFRDIQAVVTAMTNRRRNLSLVFLAALLMTTLLYTLRLLMGGSPFVYAYSIASGLFLLLLLVNWLRGPTCACCLRTAVSEEELYSLGLARTAAKAIGMLKHRIEAAQGRLEPGEVAGSMDATEGTTRSATRGRLEGADGPVKHYSGNLHAALFILLLVNGLFGSADFFYNHVAITLAGMVVFSATGIVAVAALVRQYAGKIRRGLVVTWAALGYVCVSYIIGYTLYVYISVKHMGEMKNNWELLKALSGLSPLDNPLLTAVYVFSMAAPFLIGMLGIVSARGLWNGNASPHRLRGVVKEGAA
jgi:hypothetical protein